MTLTGERRAADVQMKKEKINGMRHGDAQHMYGVLKATSGVLRHRGTPYECARVRRREDEEATMAISVTPSQIALLTH